MRKKSLVFFATVLFVAASAIAANPIKSVEPSTTLSAQIQEMLKTHTFEIESDVVANVRFTLNKEGEMVILSVDTDDAVIESFVKGRLNYKKLELQNPKEGKLYVVPVRIMP